MPPQPARVPLTFTLASGSPDAPPRIPARTLVARPPLPGDTDDVVFETERDLVVTRAVLRRSSSATPRPTPTPTAPPRRPASSTEAVPRLRRRAVHTASPLPGRRTGAEPPDIMIALSSPDSWPWLNWPIVWECWDGAGWSQATCSTRWESGAWRVALSDLPAMAPQTIDSIKAHWIRARLDLPLPPDESGNAPGLRRRRRPQPARAERSGDDVR